IWVSAALQDFATFEGRPYMYRIVNAQGETVYRTDIFSRSQIGRGATDPAKDASWTGTSDTLDGTKGCSSIVDQDTVSQDFAPPAGAVPRRIPAADFWAPEFTAGLPVPARVED